MAAVAHIIRSRLGVMLPQYFWKIDPSDPFPSVALEQLNWVPAEMDEKDIVSQYNSPINKRSDIWSSRVGIGRVIKLFCALANGDLSALFLPRSASKKSISGWKEQTFQIIRIRNQVAHPNVNVNIDASLVEEMNRKLNTWMLHPISRSILEYSFHFLVFVQLYL